MVVPFTARGIRLDLFLVQRAQEPGGPEGGDLGGLSRARLQQLIEAAAVLVDGKAAKAALKLQGGERIDIRVPQAAPMALVPHPMPLTVLFEDEHIIGLCKPAGLVVHPGAGTHAPTLVHGLLAHCGDLSGIGGVMRPGIVHRLDRGTSGVMVVAKHDRAHAHLSTQFSSRQVIKTYIAVVLGTPAPAHATVETLYGRHPVHRQRFSSRVTSGKTAITTYRTAASAFGLSLLDILLGTGRTHQIRVHLADRGHPVVGDPLYGGRQSARIANPGLRSVVEALTHQALHAACLEFTHPLTGSRLRLEAPVPATWLPLVTALRD
jgi:23S rRNA pseudouridine1911/1915/1917 synthase